MGQTVALSLVLDKPWAPPPADAMGSNPLSGTYQTADDRALWFTCLQAAKYWPLLCEAVGRPDLATEPRFTDQASLMANNHEATDELDKVFAGATLAEWRLRLADSAGQWAVMQDTLEATDDPRTVANGYVQDCERATGAPFRLAAAPVQFDGAPAAPGRAPTLDGHGDAILEELGLDWDVVVGLTVRGAVA